MANQVLEAMNSAVETAYQATQQVADINATAVESLVEKQLEILGQAVDFGVKQAKLLGEAKDVKAAVTAHTTLVETAAEQAMANVRDVIAISNTARVAYDELLNKGVQEAVAAIKPKVSKKAA